MDDIEEQWAILCPDRYPRETTRWAITGKVKLGSYGEGDDITYVGDSPLAQQMEDFHERFVYAAYAFSDNPISPSNMLDAAIEAAVGEVDADLRGAYSEITGYLWTIEDGKIGGHDMVEIFSNHVGEYGVLLVQTTPIDLGDLVAELGEA